MAAVELTAKILPSETPPFPLKAHVHPFSISQTSNNMLVGSSVLVRTGLWFMYLAKTPRSRLTTTSPESNLNARIEAYSCKATNKDKKLYRSIDHHWEDEVAFKSASPNHPSTAMILDSPFGPLDQPQARRTFRLLIAMLNVAFPDHDFSDISPDQFARETNSGAPILNALSNALTPPRDAANHHVSSGPLLRSPHHTVIFANCARHRLVRLFLTLLSRILTDVVALSECEVYTYSRDVYSDPSRRL